MLKRKKKLWTIISLSLVTLFLTNCATTTLGATNRGIKVTLAPCLTTWEELTDQDKLELPLGDFEGCDILTDKTLRDIKDNNDILRQR